MGDLVHAQDGPAFGQIPAEMAQPRVARPRSETSRRLERLRWLAGQQAWEDLCSVADELLAGEAEGWVAIEPDSYVGVREAVHRLIASLPAEGLSAYRRWVDSLAEEWLEQGAETRDEKFLRQVIDRAYCSSAGDDALWALGDILLERGDYQGARATWQQIYAATAGRERLAYPDSSIELAEVRARLALVSMRERDFSRADREIAEVKSEHPAAVGRLGGRRANLAERLSELFNEAREWPGRDSGQSDWPTLMGGSARSGVSTVDLPKNIDIQQASSVDIASPGADARLIPEAIMYPVVASGVALVRDAAGIAAAELRADSSTSAKRIFDTSMFRLPAEMWGVTVDDERMLAVAAVEQRGDKTPRTRLVGLDLSREGALLINEAPENDEALFIGPPVVGGSRVAVGELSPGQGANASVVCYDLWTGRVAWRRALGSGFHIVAPGGPPVFDVSLSLAGGALYVNTNLGMIASLRLEDGAPLWLHTYKRALGQAAATEELVGLPTSKQRPHPCIVVGSQVIVAPADFDGVLALDAASGKALWSAPLPSVDARLLAADRDRIILSGERLWAIDAATGKLDPRWGQDLSGGMGLGAVAGELVLWPTTGEILLVDRTTGKPTGKSLALPTGGGANLAVAKAVKSGDIFIVAAGPSKLTAYRANIK